MADTWPVKLTLQDEIDAAAAAKKARLTSTPTLQEAATGLGPVAPAPATPKFEGVPTVLPEEAQQAFASSNQLGFLDNLAAGFGMTAAKHLGTFLSQEGQANVDANATSLDSLVDPNDPNASYLLRLERSISNQKTMGDFMTGAFKAAFGGETDPTYVKADNVAALIEGIPIQYHSDIMANNNLAAAQRSRARVLAMLEEQRIISIQNDGGVTRMAASFVDLDAGLMVLSGGAFAAAKTAQATLRAAKTIGLAEKGSTRLSNLAVGVSGGAQAGLIFGGAEALYVEGAGTDTIIYSILMGAAMGGTLTTVLGGNTSVLKVTDDFVERVKTDDPSLTAENRVETMMDETAAPTEPLMLTPSMIVPTTTTGPSTVGAAQIGGGNTGLPRLTLVDPLGSPSATTQKITENSHRSNHDSGFYDRRGDEQASWLYKISNSSWASSVGTGLQSRMLTSKSPTMNWIGRTVFESSNGFNRGKATASALMENYHKRIQTQLEPYHIALNAWAARANQTILGTGHIATKKAKAAFNREVMLERNARNKGTTHSTDPDVRLAADAFDNAARESHRIGTGRDGEHSVDGFQNIAENPHYTPYNWSGAKINAIIRAGRATQQTLTESLAASYRAAGMSGGKDADAVANAVLRRAMLGETEMDTSVFSLLQGDGQEFLREVLRDAGSSDIEINGILSRLVGDAAERTKEGFAKSRNEVDMGTVINSLDGSDLKVVDLLSNDLSGDWQRYTRRMSGSASLARQGITNRATRKELTAAIHSEQRALGEDPTPAAELEAAFTAFDGGATKGWSSMMGGDPASQGTGVGVMKRLVQLAWMNKLGLTQLGEMGAMMAQNGLVNWTKRGPMQFLSREVKAQNKALLDDMAYITGSIGQDHKFFSEHLNLDEVSDLDKADFLSKTQGYLGDGAYIQGFTSFFNQVRTFQQTTAALGMADKVFRTLKKAMDEGIELTPLDQARFWGDFGLDGEDLNRMLNLINNGTVKFRTEGRHTFVDALNMKDWDGDLAETFGASITRNINQVVQKSMAGESDTWMHTGWGATISHLKTFPMQATQKQFVRNFRHNDPQAYATLGMGLATAMVASYIRSGISVNEKELDVADHAKRAFAYSNMTGFLPMVYDPMMTMLGLDDKRFNQFGQHSEIAPPILSLANDAIRLPGALYNAATGDADYSDKKALRTLPFSNAILVGDMFNNIGQK